MPGAHKLNWRGHFRPQNSGRINYGHETFSELEELPSDAKLLLTKNDSEIIIFEKNYDFQT